MPRKFSAIDDQLKFHFYTSIVKSHVSVKMSILQYFMCVPVKLEMNMWIM